MSKSINDLQVKLSNFARLRNWDQFHSPKNLAMALSGEVGELIEHFQWLTEEESFNISKAIRADVEEEIADVFLYLLQLCSKLDIDLVDVANKKVELNSKKYPVELSKDNCQKYTKLQVSGEETFDLVN